jgi:uncharacterized membrane protein
MDDITLARALHVLAVIHWIGGLSFVALIVLPIAGTRASANEGLELFAAVEQRFAAQVRVSVPLVGATGLWMTYRLDAWGRFIDPAYWWMTAMLGLWLFFMIMLFVLEPLLHDRFETKARRNPASALRRMGHLHVFLISLGAITVLGAVAGAHGFVFF